MLAQGCWWRIGQNLDSRGRKGPALWASGVSESRHWGGGRSYYLDTCGRLGRRDERARKALRYIPRSLVSAPAVHHSVSRWRRPAAGWGGRIGDPLRGRTHVGENPGDCQRWNKNDRGVKIIPAQIYTGVDSVLPACHQWQVLWPEHSGTDAS